MMRRLLEISWPQKVTIRERNKAFVPTGERIRAPVKRPLEKELNRQAGTPKKQDSIVNFLSAVRLNGGIKCATAGLRGYLDGTR